MLRPGQFARKSFGQNRFGTAAGTYLRSRAVAR